MTIPYLGKSNPNEKQAKNVGENIVLDLCKEYFGSDRCVTCDNFFTSVPLAIKLYENKLSMIG